MGETTPVPIRDRVAQLVGLWQDGDLGHVGIRADGISEPHAWEREVRTRGRALDTDGP